MKRVPMRFRRSFNSVLSASLFALLALAAGISIPSHAQNRQAAQNPPQDRVFRVKVGLVQTDVMVFDRQGRFVPGLTAAQFELRVDGKVQPVEFFELVSAGSEHDRQVWAKAAGEPAPEPARLPSTDANPGRTLLIFMDDWHMAADNTIRAREAVASLLRTSMGPNDRVGIFAASGQLASMQWLTNDKAALLASLEKYNYLSPGVQDMGSPPMTEAQAQSIEQKDDGVLSYFIGAIMRMPVDYSLGQCRPLGAMRMDPDFDGNCRRAADQTRRRAAALADTSVAVAGRTLSALRSLLRAAEELPGRKLVFFLSDGFVLQYQRSDILSRLADLTSAAARAGILVYTLDSRGLVTGMPDAKSSAAADFKGARIQMAANEVSAPWDALNALAVDTGGRFLKNTNALDTALTTTLAEISRYYLLAWSIDPEKLQPGRYSTIKASVKGRPDLTVRVRQGRLDLSRLVQGGK